MQWLPNTAGPATQTNVVGTPLGPTGLPSKGQASASETGLPPLTNSTVPLQLGDLRSKAGPAMARSGRAVASSVGSIAGFGKVDGLPLKVDPRRSKVNGPRVSSRDSPACKQVNTGVISERMEQKRSLIARIARMPQLSTGAAGGPALNDAERMLAGVTPGQPLAKRFAFLPAGPKGTSTPARGVSTMGRTADRSSLPAKRACQVPSVLCEQRACDPVNQPFPGVDSETDDDDDDEIKW